MLDKGIVPHVFLLNRGVLATLYNVMNIKNIINILKLLMCPRHNYTNVNSVAFNRMKEELNHANVDSCEKLLVITAVSDDQ